MGGESSTSVLSRRNVIAGGAVLAGAVAVGVGTPEAAEAATAKPVIKKVVMYRATRWSYNARTHVTTVRAYKKSTVTARFYANKIYLKNSRGVWAQIPYVYNKAKKGLWFSRSLQLQIAAAAAKAKPPAIPTTGAKVVPPSSFSGPSAYHSPDWPRHLLRRLGYGPSDSDLADVRSLGYVAWIEHQLNPALVNDAACDAILARLPNQGTPIWKVKYGIDNGDINGWDQFQSVLTDLSTRAMWSKRQLLTVLEDFWGNHFNVTIFHDGTAESRAHYQYTIRVHALGKFSDLLAAITKHPAMLTYLNNRDSTAAHPNENQGRELLELHTVGVDGGYGETDVLNSARILTGIGVDSDSGEFAYQPWNHWVGGVKVMGFTHANSTDVGGDAVVDAYVNYLAHHPSTASRLARKLAVRFVSDTPSDALVASLAHVYLANDTAIVPVLRALFSSAEFGASIGAKVARPFEHAISVARLMQVQPVSDNLDAPNQLLWQADNAGHNPFGEPFPTGHADTADAWESTATTLARWNTCINLVSNWWPNDWVRSDLQTLIFGTTLPTTHGALVDTVATKLFGRTLAPAHRDAVLAFLGVTADKAVTGSSPAVQSGGLLNDLLAILLDSPYQMMR